MRNVQQGGLKLFDPLARDMALKVMWIKRLNLMEPAYKELAMYIIKPSTENSDFWNCNFHVNDVMNVSSAHGFWSSAVKERATFNYHQVDDIDTVLKQYVWLNSHIRVANKPFIVRNLAELGVSQITEFLSDDMTRFLTFQEIKNNYPVNITQMQYNALVSAIPQKWKKMLKDLNPSILTGLETSQYNIELLMNTVKPAKIIYDRLIADTNVLNEICHKWTLKDDVTLNHKILTQTLNSSHLVKIVKYIDFQYRLIHRTILLSDILYHMKICDTQLCSSCNQSKETYRHFFMDCPKVQIIWSELCSIYALQHCNLTYENIIQNQISEFTKDNIICLIL